MQNDLAVGGGLENRTFTFQFVAQKIGVNQIAIVRDRHLATHTVDHKGLRILDRARAGRRIAGVPDRAGPFESGQFFLAKYLRDKSHVFVGQKGRARPVARDDPGAFLSAMLQRKQTVVSQHRRIRMAEHTEKSALVLRKRRGIRRLVESMLSGRDHTK